MRVPLDMFLFDPKGILDDALDHLDINPGDRRVSFSTLAIQALG